MCATTFATLTLAGMLKDPLIQAVMRSDRVSEGEFEALLFRVKDALADRDLGNQTKRELEPAWD